MSVRYLYNTKGEYVGFVTDSYVFTPECEWFGFIVNGNELFRTDGKYFGVILEDDRVVRDKTDRHRLPVLPPRKPIRPIRPIRPLRRLRMSRLPYPFIDVFDSASDPSSPIPQKEPSVDFSSVEGAEIVGGDGVFLGKLTRNRYDRDSIFNQYSEFGNRYSDKSLFNNYGRYRNPYSQFSAFSQYCTNPPKLMKDGVLLGYLTLNKYLNPRIDPVKFLEWLTAEMAHV